MRLAAVGGRARRYAEGVARRYLPAAQSLETSGEAPVGSSVVGEPAAVVSPPSGDTSAWSDLATHEDLVAAYRLFLGRPPDPHGYRSYTPYVESGWFSVTDLAARFVASVEFRNRLTTSLGWSDGVPEAVELLDGTRLYVRSTDTSVGGAIKASGDYEPHVVAKMRQILAPGQTFVDVGASLGYFTVLAGAAVGPRGRVIACEPGHQNQSVLLLNVESRHLDNVTIHHVAASDRRDVLLYSGSGGNGAVGPYGGDPASLGTHELVTAVPLDDLLAGFDRVDIIKADVEGAEGLVLRGARRTLADHRPALFLEFSPPSLEATSAMTGKEFLEELAALGYCFEVLGAPSGAGAGSVSVDEVLRIFDSSGADHLDLYAGCD